MARRQYNDRVSEMNTPAKHNLMTTVDNVKIRADTQAHHKREAFSLGSADPRAADVE